MEKKIGDERQTVGWQNDSYTIEKVTEESKPTTKANEIPYYHANVNTSEVISKRMYNNNYVNSGLITGATEEVKKKNLYDIAGNLWKYTQEIAGTVGTYTMLRGGSFFNDYTVRPACSRMGATFAYADGTTTGFRPVLYIK